MIDRTRMVARKLMSPEDRLWSVASEWSDSDDEAKALVGSEVLAMLEFYEENFGKRGMVEHVKDDLDPHLWDLTRLDHEWSELLGEGEDIRDLVDAFLDDVGV